jgi:molecular chaperone GrpE
VDEEIKDENIEEKTDIEETETVENTPASTGKSVEELEEENKDLEDRYKRLLAEFENFKKRSEKEKNFRIDMITAEVVTTMLPIMDNLEKALAAETQDAGYKEGIAMVAKQFSTALNSLGLEEIETVGKKFNPEFHDAVSHIDDPSKGEQEIVQECRKGYKIRDKVVRHSMVIVAN